MDPAIDREHPTGRAVDDERLPHLRAWRRRQSFSLRETAAAAGLNRATIIRLEARGTPARPKTVRVLAHALGITPSELRRKPPT
jgi:transcriptional regulator with XRE-family HTH domain